MKKLALPLLTMFLSLFGVLTASAQQTSFTNGPSGTFNGNHLSGCPVQIISQDRVTAYNPGSVCFQASAFQGGGFCSTPQGQYGSCVSLYFPFPVGETSGIFESGVITYGPKQFTYCAPPTIPGSDCGLNSTYSQVSTFNFWGQWMGTLVENFLRKDVYYVPGGRFRPPAATYNDIITGGSGLMSHVQL